MSGNIKKAKKHAAFGTIVSEFLGIYLLVTAIPLAINALTNDNFLRIAVFTISSFSLFIYSISEFSVIKRYIKNISYRFIYSLSLILLSLICFISQTPDNTTYTITSILIFLYLTITVFILVRKKEHYADIVK